MTSEAKSRKAAQLPHWPLLRSLFKGDKVLDKKLDKKLDKLDKKHQHHSTPSFQANGTQKNSSQPSFQVTTALAYVEPVSHEKLQARTGQLSLFLIPTHNSRPKQNYRPKTLNLGIICCIILGS